jgi:hypothetical protein
LLKVWSQPDFVGSKRNEAEESGVMLFETHGEAFVFLEFSKDYLLCKESKARWPMALENPLLSAQNPLIVHTS